nr:hypothetical protein [Propionibacterium sp.]
MRAGSVDAERTSGAAAWARLTRRIVAPAVSFALVVGFVATATPTAAASTVRSATGEAVVAEPGPTATADTDGVRPPLLPAGSAPRLRDAVTVSLPVLPRDEAQALVARLAASGTATAGGSGRSAALGAASTSTVTRTVQGASGRAAAAQAAAKAEADAKLQEALDALARALSTSSCSATGADGGQAQVSCALPSSAPTATSPSSSTPSSPAATPSASPSALPTQAAAPSVSPTPTASPSVTPTPAASEPAPEPEPAPAPTPEPEPTPDPASQPAPEPAAEPEPAPEPAPAAEPAAEPEPTADEQSGADSSGSTGTTGLIRTWLVVPLLETVVGLAAVDGSAATEPAATEPPATDPAVTEPEPAAEASATAVAADRPPVWSVSGTVATLQLTARAAASGTLTLDAASGTLVFTLDGAEYRVPVDGVDTVVLRGFDATASITVDLTGLVQVLAVDVQGAAGTLSVAASDAVAALTADTGRLAFATDTAVVRFDAPEVALTVAAAAVTLTGDQPIATGGPAPPSTRRARPGPATWLSWRQRPATSRPRSPWRVPRSPARTSRSPPPRPTQWTPRGRGRPRPSPSSTRR